MLIGDRSQNRENTAEVLGTASQGATADTAGCSRVSRSCGHGSCKRGGRNQHEPQRRNDAEERQPVARAQHGDNSRKRENRSRKKAPKPSREPQQRHVLRNLHPKQGKAHHTYMVPRAQQDVKENRNRRSGRNTGSRRQ